MVFKQGFTIIRVYYSRGTWNTTYLFNRKCKKMAALKVNAVEGLEKLLTCSICLNILTSPRTLPCTHSYCEQCLVQKVKTIQQNGTDGILCPLCRTFFKKGEHLQLYILRELLEFYSLLNKPQSKTCHLCEEGTETAAVWICVNCKIYLCKACQKKHKKTPNSITHTYRPCDVETTLDINCYCEKHPDHVIDLYCVHCDKCICLKCKVTDHEGHKSETIAAGIERLTPVMNKKLDSVLKHVEELKHEEKCLQNGTSVVKTKTKEVKEEYKKSKDALISCIEKQYKAIVQTLDRYEKDNLKQIEVACEKTQAQKEVKQNIADLCKTTLATASGCSLLKGLTEGLMQKVSEEERKPVVHAEVKLKHRVFKKNPDVGERLTFLKEPSILNDFKVLFPWKVRELNVRFDEIMSQVGECVDRVHLKGNPYRLCVVDSNIWIPGDTDEVDYEVLNISTKTLTEMKCDTLDTVKSLCQTHTGHVIAACDNGLFAVNTQGELQYELSGGSFTDVCTNGEKVLAVQYRTYNVEVYTLTSNKWSKEAEFPLEDGQDATKTLHVDRNNVYVCYYETNTIYKYSLQGEFLEEYGGSEGNALGQFYVPYVSGTDSEQALIVNDWLNHRVQVRSRQGDWKQYTLEGVTRITDVIIVAEFLFVLHGKTNSMKLLFYKIITQQ